MVQDDVRMELDSHADTCVVGKDTALIIQDFERPVQVHGYLGDVGKARNCKTVSAVVAYDHPETGETFFLVIHQAILIDKMKKILLCPMQLRDNGLRVNDEPRFMSSNPTNEHNTISVPNSMGDGLDLRIPLDIQGVFSGVHVRVPTSEEFEASAVANRIELTSEDIEWDPASDIFKTQEDAMVDLNGNLVEKQASANWLAAIRTIPAVSQPEGDFGTALEKAVRISSTTRAARRNIARVRCLKVVKSRSLRRVNPEQLAKAWSIGLATATKTIDATTHRGVRTLIDSLSRRYRTNDRHLRYRRLPHDVYSDTLESKEVSWFRKNRYAQIFTTRYGWTRVYPMRKKSEAHEGLSKMAQQDGVPPVLIVDGSKEQTLGPFRAKARQMGTRLKQTEPGSPWQNAAEIGVRETKKGAARKADRKKSPAKLWDNCLELEAKIRSNTALNLYELEGQVPETIMLGQTADISSIAEHEWYDWVKYWDNKAQHPAPSEVHGRWLGPSDDVGSAMTAKILKKNGQVLDTSSYRSLTDDELQSPEEQEERRIYDEEIRNKLGRPAGSPEEIDEEAATPEFDPYDDDETDEKPAPVPDIEDVTPEERDNYVGASVNLPYRGEMRSGTVRRRARDEQGETTGTMNDNPILDTRTYEVEFDDKETGTSMRSEWQSIRVDERNC